MLAVRPEQLEGMRRYAVEQYAQRTLKQFKQYFTRHCAIIGDEPMRNMLVLGVERAKRHRIIGECNVVLYTSLMLLFGSYFDEDPQYAWSKQALEQDRSSPEAVSAERLYDCGAKEWECLAGKDNIDLVKVLVRLRSVSYEDLSQVSSQPLLPLLQSLYPQKARHIGDERMLGLLRQCGTQAAQWKIGTPAGVALVVVLAFLCGSGFGEDPMFPWATEPLTAPGLGAAERTRTLYNNAIGYSQAWLAAVRQENR